MKTAKTALPPKNKHQARTEATLRGLLDAAETAFVRDGYERAQIETIAAEAGRTKGAVYAHFKSKEDIFFALLETKAQSRLDMFLRSAKDVPHAHRVQIVKDLFLNTVEEKNWPILILEFKLFALRNKASLRRIRDLYQLLYDDLSRDLLPENEGFTDAQKEKALVALAVLRGLPSAIALERHFNPVMNLSGTTKEVLEAIFESLLKMNDRTPASSRPKASPKANRSCKPPANRKMKLA
jgi:AcrR family transcriptional regulator